MFDGDLTDIEFAKIERRILKEMISNGEVIVMRKEEAEMRMNGLMSAALIGAASMTSASVSAAAAIRDFAAVVPRREGKTISREAKRLANRRDAHRPTHFNHAGQSTKLARRLAARRRLGQLGLY